MRALSSVFDVCVLFCDLVDEDNQQNLGIFLRTSAAVLFGSDFQRKRDTLNETDYAMDELARHSSYALSNIMLTYPATVPMAEAILGKRLPCLFKFLHSSPEMSINRSLILMLRSLYTRYETDRDGSEECKDLIEKEFSYEGGGRRSVLHLFRKIDLASEDADAQAENVSLKMLSGDNREACFKTVNCSIQVKEQNGVSRCRVPFRTASVDWNRNSFVVQRPRGSPECWPFFLVSRYEWKKGKTELHLQTDHCLRRKACRIVLRFNSKSVSESMKSIIHGRLRDVKERIHSSEFQRVPSRKASLADMKGTSLHTMSEIHADVGCKEKISREHETVAKESKQLSGAGERHILSTAPPPRCLSSGPYAATDNAIGNTPSESPEKYTPTKRAPESFEAIRTNNDSQHSSPCFEPIIYKSDEYEMDASPGFTENGSTDEDKTKYSRANDSSADDDLSKDCNEKESQGQSDHYGTPIQTSEPTRFDVVMDVNNNSYSQPMVPEQSIGKLVDTDSIKWKMMVPDCRRRIKMNVLTPEDEQLRHKLHSVVKRILEVRNCDHNY